MHRFSLWFGWRFEGVGTEAFEFRVESSRLNLAKDDTEHRVGVALAARW